VCKPSSCWARSSNSSGWPVARIWQVVRAECLGDLTGKEVAVAPPERLLA
jgi:hypothetical protein